MSIEYRVCWTVVDCCIGHSGRGIRPVGSYEAAAELLTWLKKENDPSRFAFIVPELWPGEEEVPSMEEIVAEHQRIFCQHGALRCKNVCSVCDYGEEENGLYAFHYLDQYTCLEFSTGYYTALGGKEVSGHWRARVTQYHRWRTGEKHVLLDRRAEDEDAATALINSYFQMEAWEGNLRDTDRWYPASR